MMPSGNSLLITCPLAPPAAFSGDGSACVPDVQVDDEPADANASIAAFLSGSVRARRQQTVRWPGGQGCFILGYCLGSRLALACGV